MVVRRWWKEIVVKVGCCGWAVKGGMKKYFELFDLIELQSTFYKLPTIETASRWRAEAPQNFTYTMKAWQVITHPSTSPTWRKSGLRIPHELHEKYGLLKPTDENFEAWRRTIEIAKALRCRVIVIQLPPSFVRNNENVVNVKVFMSTVERPDGIDVGMEFRHESWDFATIRSLCEELNLVHIVDPLKHEPAITTGQILYYRLHGLGARAYVYDYSISELQTLYSKWVKPYEKEKEVYVLFNNTNMANDALDLKRIAVT
ncbi:MAG: DUF72 domain-containing protein [Candidatus Nezhaarchaeota archaeon]|nr:DUF72 domain-containing protein [Candidatus Nezhaarchaeota archaeon]MCX8142037.1 DUF72 domain-containing protein [Candidatus Nezhaarchaeota archaeon]MDW8050182.1 DUF72 domain-containing protein [Nitrososphaerota archaeon]